MEEIKNLKPECIWRNFDALTKIPRPSAINILFATSCAVRLSKPS